MTKIPDYSKNISGTDDCCGNCTAFEPYLKVPRCKKINADPDMAEFRPVAQGICPLHNRVTCLQCKAPVHHPCTSLCDDCKRELIEKANDEVLIDITTGEVVGKRKDIALIRSDIDLF